jgi:hypothetical protein
MSPVSDVTAFRTRSWKLDHFLKANRLAVSWVIDTGGVFGFLVHPPCLLIEDPNFESIKSICDLVKKCGAKAALVSLDTIAARAQKK